MTTIGIIDEYSLVRLGLELLFSKELPGFTIKTAGNFDTFYSLYAHEQIDLIILGLNQFPSKANNEILASYKKYYSLVPLMVYADSHCRETLISYLQSGMKGYLLKKDTPASLISCSLALLDGNYYFSESFKTILVKEAVKPTFPSPVKSRRKYGALTSRQLAIAIYLAQGCRTSTIAVKLNLRSSTISVTKNTIFKKLRINNVIELSEILSGVNGVPIRRPA